jgi:hypothetical protein
LFITSGVVINVSVMASKRKCDFNDVLQTEYLLIEKTISDFDVYYVTCVPQHLIVMVDDQT